MLRHREGDTGGGSPGTKVRGAGAAGEVSLLGGDTARGFLWLLLGAAELAGLRSCELQERGARNPLIPALSMEDSAEQSQEMRYHMLQR